MSTATYRARCPFRFGDRVELPGMLHLGTGRVIHSTKYHDWYAGPTWCVQVKLAATGAVIDVPDTKIRKA